MNQNKSDGGSKKCRYQPGIYLTSKCHDHTKHGNVKARNIDIMTRRDIKRDEIC